VGGPGGSFLAAPEEKGLVGGAARSKWKLCYDTFDWHEDLRGDECYNE
jgi:hypothetical protein